MHPLCSGGHCLWVQVWLSNAAFRYRGTEHLTVQPVHGQGPLAPPHHSGAEGALADKRKPWLSATPCGNPTSGGEQAGWGGFSLLLEHAPCCPSPTHQQAYSLPFLLSPFRFPQCPGTRRGHFIPLLHGLSDEEEVPRLHLRSTRGSESQGPAQHSES